ncbi:hypothetical protein CEXT_570891 [Caerostris extrusa]|uniref:Uncharacterized protein n=1 Tax=Caerostris extrusa TaxID=172846 RepID=A0AAV4MKN2_CAEEX|nr:hypothetical protein CEXT_570891 [Caerostris extrusa]
MSIPDTISQLLHCCKVKFYKLVQVTFPPLCSSSNGHKMAQILSFDISHHGLFVRFTAAEQPFRGVPPHPFQISSDLRSEFRSNEAKWIKWNREKRARPNLYHILRGKH